MLISQLIIKLKKRCFVDNLFFVFEFFCNQNGNEVMENIFIRIVALGMSIIGLVLVNSFGAVITAYLAVEIPKIPFIDFDQFVENGQYQLAMCDVNNVLNEYFKVIKQYFKHKDYFIVL